MQVAVITYHQVTCSFIFTSLIPKLISKPGYSQKINTKIIKGLNTIKNKQTWTQLYSEIFNNVSVVLHSDLFIDSILIPNKR